MTDPINRLKPDDVIPPEGPSIQGRQLIADAALMLPNLAKLVARLIADPRVPRRSKIVLGFAAAYVASPIDLIPEFIPVLGWADDVLLMMYALDSLIDRAGPKVVEEHWDGPGDLLGLIRDVMGMARNLIPRRLIRTIDRLSG
ncbi:MAG TPA: YkvA family protein [Acidimicrobiia bacterium]|nr:YkvA family protein [Acidimicrobiia bacterium]